MRKLISNGVFITASLMTPLAMGDSERPTPTYNNDPRLSQLREFFSKFESPASQFAADFLAAADRYDLDWRLLPSISIIESGGGKAYRNNNIFGWDSCNVAFPTIPHGIHHVAERLANSRLYRDKDLDSILTTYNHFDGYADRVKRLMRKLATEPALAAT